MSWRQELKIDRYSLESELVRQPQLYMTWALKAVRAGIEKDDAVNDLEIVKAEVDEKIRNNPERYGIPEGKVTDRAIKLAVAKHKRVNKYFRHMLKKKKQEKILNEAKKGFEQRKKMLESLVSLNIQLHFAEPKVPLAKQAEIYDSDRQAMVERMKKNRIRRRKNK